MRRSNAVNIVMNASATHRSRMSCRRLRVETVSHSFAQEIGIALQNLRLPFAFEVRRLALCLV